MAQSFYVERGGIVLKALVVLEDGFTLTGECFSGGGEVFGEMVFNTGMTGYQEMITDPSYRGQILTFTYPLIGNYGANEYDIESASPQVEAVLVKECCRRPRNFRSRESLPDYLDRNGILGVEGIDTRTLTLRLRRAGTMKGAVSTKERDPAALLERVTAYPGIGSRELVREVSSPKPQLWTRKAPGPFFMTSGNSSKPSGYHIVVYDFGVKYSILHYLSARGCRTTVVPYHTPAAELLTLKPDGVLLSNGPGDPEALRFMIPEIRSLLGRLPLFGICLGHQVLGLAAGLRTFKLPFGHRGGNHPVKDLLTGQVQITSQNHGYCVRLEDLKGDTVPTHINLNDLTLEGMGNRALGFFSVQYHPEASPGPHDANYLFDKFMALVGETKGKEAGNCA